MATEQSMVERQRAVQNRGEPQLRHVCCYICEPCIAGEGQECHTPGCMMFLHRVDIPFTRECFDFLDAALADVPASSSQRDDAGVADRDGGAGG